MTATFIQSFNTALNLLGLAIAVLAVLYFAPRAWRAAESKAREEEMQRTIDAYKGRVEALEPQVENLRDEVKECRDTASKWEGRYNEQAKYTAQGALSEVLVEMEKTRKVFETSMSGLGDLMMEHSQLVARALDRLDGGSET